MSDRYEKLRAEYEGQGLDGVTSEEPWSVFERWQTDAESAELPLANAMALATCGADGQPSVRMVLLKNIDADQRLWFFTDYESDKGRALADNPRASLLFYWQPLHRQIRIQGSVARLDASDSDAYFAARPRKSSLSAMTSHQSHVVSGPAELEEARAKLEADFAGRDLERPPRWGGFALSPVRFEFWQGRPDRLHHRLRYLRDDSGEWSRSWLAP